MAIEMKMPRLSDTMEQGTVVRWAVKPGQKVKSGDVVADIETDKATMELQTFDDGVVADIAVPEGSTVNVGTIIMRLAESGESVDAVKAAAPSKGEAGGTQSGGPAPTKDAPAAQAINDRHGVISGAAGSRASSNGQHSGGGQSDHNESDRVFASPLAKKVASEHNVNLAGVQGTGPSGRIVRKDVEAAVAGGQSAAPSYQKSPNAAQRMAPAPMPMAGASLSSRSVPLSNMRATIAKRLVESKTTIPHYQVTVSVRMDALLTLRAQLNEQLATQGVKLSVNDFLVRACALAMHSHPHVNSRWNQSQGGSPSVELQGEVNIGVAIALPLNEKGEGGGLVVATLRHADRMGLRQISGDSKRLADKARGKGLSIDEMSDSSFTISNLGMFGVEHFTAIINPPNAAILAIGGAIEQPVVETDATTGAKSIGIGHVMHMTMSSDHRIIDGAMAAQYLSTVKELLQKPATLLV